MRKDGKTSELVSLWNEYEAQKYGQGSKTESEKQDNERQKRVFKLKKLCKGEYTVTHPELLTPAQTGELDAFDQQLAYSDAKFSVYNQLVDIEMAENWQMFPVSDNGTDIYTKLRTMTWLTDDQRNLWQLLAEGYSKTEIQQLLGIGRTALDNRIGRLRTIMRSRGHAYL